MVTQIRVKAQRLSFRLTDRSRQRGLMVFCFQSFKKHHLLISFTVYLRKTTYAYMDAMVVIFDCFCLLYAKSISTDIQPIISGFSLRFYVPAHPKQMCPAAIGQWSLQMAFLNPIIVEILELLMFFYPILTSFNQKSNIKIKIITTKKINSQENNLRLHDFSLDFPLVNSFWRLQTKTPNQRPISARSSETSRGSLE